MPYASIKLPIFSKDLILLTNSFSVNMESDPERSLANGRKVA